MIALSELDAVLCICIFQVEHWLQPAPMGVKPFLAALSLVRTRAGFVYQREQINIIWFSVGPASDYTGHTDLHDRSDNQALPPIQGQSGRTLAAAERCRTTWPLV